MGERPDKPLVWLHGEVKSPPFSRDARIETGTLLRRLQQGELLGLPHSRPMPSVAARCHELRVADRGHDWRILYRLDTDAVVIAEVFVKKTKKTPEEVLERSRKRLRGYDQAAHGKGRE
jgi:phage-related protein